MSKKAYVIDTNVLIGAGERVFDVYRNDDIYIPLEVVKSLERNQFGHDGRAWACKSVIKALENIRAKAKVGYTTDNGVGNEYGGSITVKRVRATRDGIPNLDPVVGLADQLIKDNRIEPIVVSNELATRLQADSLKIEATPFTDCGSNFTGWLEESELDNIDVESISHAAVHDNDDCYYLLKRGMKQEMPCTIHSRNVRPAAYNMAQVVALHYLLDDEISVVSLGGIAGAGKSFLALAAGIDQVKSGRYDRIQVYRSMYAVQNQEIGFLPGEQEDKIAPWARPIWANIDQIDSINGDLNKGKNNLVEPAQKRHTGDISVEPITFIRGITLSRTFVIVDDAQSLERTTILDIISRLGKGSKIVFTYDMTQQDNRFVSSGTSIVSLIDDFKSSPEFAHISFDKSERSDVAQFAGELLAREFH
ncbi:MAG: PhoH family protein [Candidatus Saccharibacteria bacterium]|nr:PhoH family protein [Candidatus Saccharibacteria bacterium]